MDTNNNGNEDAGENMFDVISGQQFTFTIKVSNAAGFSTATGVQAKDLLPAGLTYVSSVASQGSFNSGTGVWTVGTLAGGASATLKITVTASATVAAPPPTGGSPSPIGSLFEGGDGNLTVNTSGNLDWANAPNLVTQNDQPDADDNIFVQGTKEDDAVPTIDPDHAAPSKDNLVRYYVASEQVSGKVYLYLAWVRSDTNGDATIDFELNQSSVISANGVTPVRTVGDLLITYDFDNGGGTSTISLRRWTGSAWGAATTLPATVAIAAVNSGTVTDPVAGGTLSKGQFGEAAINLTAAFSALDPNGCEVFSSAFVKSRASTSFQAELKDFIKPVPIHIATCVLVTNQAQITAADQPDIDSTPNNGFHATPEDDEDSLDVTIHPVSPLLALGGPAPSGGQFLTPLTYEQLKPIVAEAKARWAATGFDAAQLDRLGHATIGIRNIGGDFLGLTSGTAIWLDDDAAGYGWFADPTPGDDSEFHTPGDQGEQGRMDLLSVVMHEMGHVLGLDDLDEAEHRDDLMAESLAPGVRHLPTGATPDVVSEVNDFAAFAPGAGSVVNWGVDVTSQPRPAARNGTFSPVYLAVSDSDPVIRNAPRFPAPVPADGLLGRGRATPDESLFGIPTKPVKS